MRISTLRSLLYFIVGMLLCVCVFAAQPMNWSTAFTYYGSTSNSPMVYWNDSNEPPAQWYELRYIWLERPTLGKTMKLLPKDVSRVKQTSGLLAGQYVVGRPFKPPGQGHFTIEVRNCFSTATDGCTTWSSSVSPSDAVVTLGKGQAWWLYFYLDKPASVTPLP